MDFLILVVSVSLWQGVGAASKWMVLFVSTLRNLVNFTESGKGSPPQLSSCSNLASGGGGGGQPLSLGIKVHFFSKRGVGRCGLHRSDND